MTALADLATMAVDNARLHERQVAALAELEDAQTELQAKVALLDEAATTEKAFIDTVLDNGPVLGGVSRILHGKLGLAVAIITADGAVESVAPRDAPTDDLVAAYHELRESLTHHRGMRVQIDGSSVWVQPIELGGDEFGAVCVAGADADADESLDSDRVRLASSQAAVACALFHLQQRAASLARAEALDQILWDLIDSSPEHQTAARGRAQQMGVWLRGPHRVLYGQVENLEHLADEQHWSQATTDRARRSLVEALKSAPVRMTLVSGRGNWLVALVPLDDRDRAREFLRSLNAHLALTVPDVSVTWGLSTARDHPGRYPQAFAEARTALAAARRLGSVSLYDDLGIVRLLLGHEDSDFQTFVREVTGPLQEYDEANDGALMKTLRAYFDSNCSQKAAAELLYVHHKTMAYRLDRIRRLTGLDLTQHADRMRADLALRLLEVSDQVNESGGRS